MLRVLLFSFLMTMGAPAYAACGAGSPFATVDDGTGNCEPKLDIDMVGGLPVIPDACQAYAHVFTPISVATASGTTIVAGAAAKKTYICHLMLITGAATNVGIVEGTGANCATGTAGVIGGATAATGVNLASNTGFVEGNGASAVAATATAADNLCLLPSAANQVSGVIVTVQK